MPFSLTKPAPNAQKLAQGTRSFLPNPNPAAHTHSSLGSGYLLSALHSSVRCIVITEPVWRIKSLSGPLLGRFVTGLFSDSGRVPFGGSTKFEFWSLGCARNSSRSHLRRVVGAGPVAIFKCKKLPDLLQQCVWNGIKKPKKGEMDESTEQPLLGRAELSSEAVQQPQHSQIAKLC